jgi:hypothetical protein
MGTRDRGNSLRGTQWRYGALAGRFSTGLHIQRILEVRSPGSGLGRPGPPPTDDEYCVPRQGYLPTKSRLFIDFLMKEFNDRNY